MKKANRILWGIILIGVGLLLGLNAFEIIHIDLFFDGWWTLFIIIPSIIGLISSRDKTGSIIGLCIGVFLLLCCRDVLGFDIIWKLLLPVIIIIFGIRMISGGFKNGKSNEVIKKIKENGEELRCSSAIFSGQNMNFSGEVFHGAELNAVFGGLKCDLRNAVFESDCVIHASAVFGGIDILVPNNINVRINSNSIFGGASNKTAHNQIENAVTLYIKADCLFGGVEIK